MPSLTRKKQRGAPSPLVVFVDLGMMLSFDQLAGALRARGIEVAHLTMSGNPLARLSSRIVYQHTHYFTQHSQIAALLSGLDVDRVVDVQCPEFLLEPVLAAATTAGIPQRVLDQLAMRVSWRDKFVVARRLEAAGIPAPTVIDLAEMRPGEIVDELGLPLVLKRRVGSGGEGVRIVEHAEELAGVAADLEREGTVYAEQFLCGTTLCFSAAFSGGEVVTSCVYRTLQAARAEGPSSSIEVVEDDEVDQIGHRLVGLLAGDGLVNLDLVRDRSGRAHVVDVNVRSWHSVVALAKLGHNFVDAYLVALGLDEHIVGEPLGSPRTGRVNVFPDQSEQALATSRRAGVQRFVADLCGQRAVLPPRYLAAQSLLFARRVAGARPRGEQRGA